MEKPQKQKTRKKPKKERSYEHIDVLHALIDPNVHEKPLFVPVAKTVETLMTENRALQTENSRLADENEALHNENDHVHELLRAEIIDHETEAESLKDTIRNLHVYFERLEDSNTDLKFSRDVWAAGAIVIAGVSIAFTILHMLSYHW